MSNTLVDIADAVAVLLNAGDYSQEFTAARKYRPLDDRATLDGYLVRVVPTGVTSEAKTRRDSQHDYTVEIGIKAPAVSESDIDAAMTLAQEIQDAVEYSQFPTLRATWIATEVPTPFFADEFDTANQITIILNVTYRVL